MKNTAASCRVSAYKQTFPFVMRVELRILSAQAPRRSNHKKRNQSGTRMSRLSGSVGEYLDRQGFPTPLQTRDRFANALNNRNMRCHCEAMNLAFRLLRCRFYPSCCRVINFSFHSNFPIVFKSIVCYILRKLK